MVKETGIWMVLIPLIVSVAFNVPALRPVGSAVTESVVGVLPLAGVTFSHDALVCTVKGCPAVALETVTVCAAVIAPPSWPINARDVLSAVSVCPVTPEIVNVTGMRSVLAPAIVTVACTVPTPSPVGSAVTVRDVGVLPEVGLIFNQEALELALNARPALDPVTVRLWLTAEPPCCAENEREDLSTASD